MMGSMNGTVVVLSPVRQLGTFENHENKTGIFDEYARIIR